MILPFQPVPNKRGGARKHLTMQEWRALLAAAKAAGPRDHLLIRLIYECGLRASEAGLLRLEHCKRLQDQFLWIIRGKKGRKRRANRPPGMWAEISKELGWLIYNWIAEVYPDQSKRTPRAYLFVGKRRYGRVKQGISRHTVYKRVRALCLEAGIQEDLAHPHAIRHARCQHLFEAADEQGLPPEVAIKLAAKIVGHASARTTYEQYMTETGRGRELADWVLRQAMEEEDD
jgi:integrase